MTFRESSTSFAGTIGVELFTRIGFSRPTFTAHFGGTVEIVCGLLVLAGLWTRIAAIPLLIVICAAIVTTKIPELTHAGQGFWFRVSDTRTDFAMLMWPALFDCLGIPESSRNSLLWTLAASREGTTSSA
jgi:uncharacterized membrane protein YphA (DoxX/SURF4 family)